MFDKGLTLSLPCSLGRRNLAELWWKYCPKGCHAERPQAKPCARYCSPVRRKSHRSRLSREIVSIDASGNVNLLAKHTEIVRWSHDHCGVHLNNMKRIVPGENYILAIGDFLEQPDKPWMIFQVGMCPVVSPDRSYDIQVDEGIDSHTRRRLFHSEHGNVDSHDDLFDLDETAKGYGLHRNRANPTATAQLHQSSSSSIIQSDSSAGDKLDTQEDGAPGDAKRSLISPQSRVHTKDKLDNVYYGKLRDAPMQPRQLTFSDPPKIDPGTSTATHKESSSPSVARNSFRESIQSHESALCLPSGETQNTYENRMTLTYESPLVEGSNPQSVVELPLTGKCRDWSLDDWVKLSRQNLASGFGRRVVDLVTSMNRGAVQSNLQLPTLFDDSTIGMPFKVIEKKAALPSTNNS